MDFKFKSNRREVDIFSNKEFDSLEQRSAAYFDSRAGLKTSQASSDHKI
jgi:hypothetical protein